MQKIKHVIFDYRSTDWGDVGQHSRAIQELSAAFYSQPFHSWITENDIKLSVVDCKDISSMSILFRVIAEFDPTQLTFFLLKYANRS